MENGVSMQTDVFRLGGDPSSWAEPLARAAATLRAGGLVAFPTETVYGLGASALDSRAVAALFAAKGRPATNPVIVHVATVAQARALAAEWPPLAERLAAEFWPGPLTLIVAKAPCIPDSVTAGGPTVALRMPSHPVAAALLEASGGPIAAPSANPSEQLSSTTATHVLKGLMGKVDVVLDAGPAPGGMESTVVDVTVDPPVIRRHGLIAVGALRPYGVADAAAADPPPGSPASSPGQHVRHYAPSVPLHIVSSLPEGLEKNAGYVVYAEHPPHPHCLRLPDDPRGYAAGFYATLHALEDDGVVRIEVVDPPHAAGWEAIHDRLRRASAR